MTDKFISIEGNIGAGKTTLAKALATLSKGQLILERFEENPYLIDFYRDKKKWAYDTELFFLKDRIKQLSQIKEEKGTIISDFSLIKSKLFAGITLNNNDLKQFISIYNQGNLISRQPDVILYLTNELASIQNSIDLRGRPYENRIRRNYLAKIETAYQTELLKLKNIPIIFLDKTNLNFPYQSDELLKIFNFCLSSEHKGVMYF